MHSLALELDELRFKLLMVVFDLRWSRGRLDREFVQRAGEIARYYSGAIADHPSRSHVIEFAGYAEQQLAALNAMPEDPRRAKSLQRYCVPFLSSRLEAVSILPFSVQRRLFELLARLSFYNVAVERLEVNLGLTFTPGLSSENWRVIQTNNQVSLASVDRSGMDIIGHIDALMPMLG